MAMLPCSGKNRLLEEPDCRVLPATPLFLYMMSHAHHESWLRKCRLFPNVGRPISQVRLVARFSIITNITFLIYRTDQTEDK